MKVTVAKDLNTKFQEIFLEVSELTGITAEPKNNELEKFKQTIVSEIKSSYALESLKDVPIIRRYRDFYWRIGIDPTKIRPASEALIRRILQDKPLPVINSAVDAYNLASIKTHIAIGAFDKTRLKGDLELRFANENESFVGIGMSEPKLLHPNEIVLSDGEKIVAVYPYRDSDNTKITHSTKEVVLLFCGVPGIERKELLNARDLACEYITRFCGGEIKR